MGNEKDKVDSFEITTREGEVIVLDNPTDSSQWQRTADIIRLVSAAKSTVVDARPVDKDETVDTAQNLFPTHKDTAINVSNQDGLQLPAFVRRMRAKRVASLKNKPKAA